MTLDSTDIFRNELLTKLKSLTADSAPARWIVAFSGGIDSSVLLHALAKSGTATPVVAVHVNHGLHPESHAWALRCQEAAKNLGVEFLGLEVVVDETASGGPEAAARDARYAAFRDIVEANDCLLSAHHEDDQAETLLLNLMRGSGVAGLAGIGAHRVFGKGLLLRPLLDVSLQSIKSYADAEKLTWVEDPSNIDTRFDRNFLRLEIVPVLASRWPAVSDRLRHSAELVGEASELLTDLADIDLGSVGSSNRLSVSRLRALSAPRQRNLLRRAIQRQGLPAPPGTRLRQIVDELIPARADAQPLVSWAGAEIRRYRDELFILAENTHSTPPACGKLLAGGDRLELGHELGALELAATDIAGIAPDIAEAGLDLRFRDGGEEIRVVGRESAQKLKKLLQEAAVLPWMRGLVPLLYQDERLVAVADMWIDAESTTSPGYIVNWLDRPILK